MRRLPRGDLPLPREGGEIALGGLQLRSQLLSRPKRRLEFSRECGACGLGLVESRLDATGVVGVPKRRLGELVAELCEGAVALLQLCEGTRGLRGLRAQRGGLGAGGGEGEGERGELAGERGEGVGDGVLRGVIG